MSDSDDWTTVDALADDPSILAALDRSTICRAVRLVARQTGGVVTGATIRREFDRPVNPHRIGAIMSRLVKGGLLIDTGGTARSEDAKNRNRNRRLPLYRVPNIGAVR